MTYLFFDTETTGLPNFKMHIDWEGQPHICQIGAILTTKEGRLLGEMNLMIRPDGWKIPEDASSRAIVFTLVRPKSRCKTLLTMSLNRKWSKSCKTPLVP